MTLDDYFGEPPLPKQALLDQAVSMFRSAAERDEMLVALSTLALVYEHSEVLDELCNAVRSRLAPEVRDRFDGARKKRVVLARQPILHAFREVLRNGSREASDREWPALLASFFLMHGLSANLGSAAKGPGSGEMIAGMPAELVIELISNQIFNESSDPIVSLDRTLRVWTDYGAFGKPFLADREPAEILAAATGMQIEDILFIGFVLYAQASSWTPTRPVLTNLTSELELPAGIGEAFLQLFSATPDEMNHALETAESDWDFLPFQQRPLLRIGPGVLFTDVQLFLSRITSGLYWLAHDYLRDSEGDKSRHSWTQAWGAMIEAMVEDSLRPTAPALLGPGTTFYTEKDLASAFPTEGQSRADVVVDFGTELLVFEVVSGQISVPTRVAGSKASLESDLERLVFKKVRQLHGTAMLLVNDSSPLTGVEGVRRVVPILVAAGGFPFSPVTETIVRTYCREMHLLEDARIGTLVILDMGEIEILEALAAKNHPVNQVIREWKESTLKDMSFLNYAIDRYGGTTDLRPPRVRTHLDPIFESWINRVQPMQVETTPSD